MGRKGWIILAVLLLAVGVGSLFIEGIHYVTQETVVDVGGIEVSAEQEDRVVLPIWLSLVLAGAGLVALLIGIGAGRKGI